MNVRDLYKRAPEEWPKWLTESERKKIFQAAKNTEDAERNIILIASIMYLGLSVKDAIQLRYCTFFGDAIENKKKGAFLHIPKEYRQMVLEIKGKQQYIQMSDLLMICTETEAKSAIVQVFKTAGIDSTYCIERLKRTAASLHYMNQWTWEGNIERWFTETGLIKTNKERFYADMYDEYSESNMKGFSLVPNN